MRRLFTLLAVLWTAMAAAQTPVTPAQFLAWDHDGANTSSFKLCVDSTPCTDIAGGATVRRVAIPAMTPGLHTLAVQACNADGCARSPALSVRMVVLPADPSNLRIEDASPGGGELMAIAQRGTGTRAGFGSGTTVTGTEPAGTVSGDVLIAKIIVAGNQFLSEPVGWTPIAGPQVSVDNDFTAGVYLIVRGGSAPSLLWTWGGANIYRELEIDAWSGVNTANPVNQTATTTSGNRTTPNCPPVTPNVNDAMILAIAYQWFGAGVGGWTAPTNYTLTHTSNAGEDTGVARRLLVGGSGVAEDPGAWSAAGGSDATWEVTIALAPAVTGDQTIAAGANTMTVTAPSPTVATLATIVASTPSIGLSAPAAIAVPGAVTRVVGANALTFSALSPTLLEAIVLGAGAASVALMAAHATLLVGPPPPAALRGETLVFGGRRGDTLSGSATRGGTLTPGSTRREL